MVCQLQDSKSSHQWNWPVFRGLSFNRGHGLWPGTWTHLELWRVVLYLCPHNWEAYLGEKQWNIMKSTIALFENIFLSPFSETVSLFKVQPALFLGFSKRQGHYFYRHDSTEHLIKVWHYSTGCCNKRRENELLFIFQICINLIKQS